MRTHAPERWLTTLWAPAGVRPLMLAIHTYDLEVQRIVGSIKDPLLAEIRLAWWREQLQALADGKKAPAQPLLQALAAGRHDMGQASIDLTALARVEDGVLPLLSDGPPDLTEMAERRGEALFTALAQAMGRAEPLPAGAGTGFALACLARGPWGHVGHRLKDTQWPAPPARVTGRLPGPLAALDALGRADVARVRRGRPPAPYGTAGRQWRMWWAGLTGR